MDFRIIKTVISREYSTRVKKKSFLVTTFVVPILFAAFIVGVTYIMGNTKQRKQDVAVVDQSGIVFSHLENTDRLTFADYSLSDPDSLKADLDAIGKDVLVVISPLDTVSKSVSVSAYSGKPLGVEFTSGLAGKVDKAVEEYRVRQYGIDNLSKIMEEVRSDVKINEYTLGEDGKESVSESGIYMIVSMLLGIIIWMFIVMFGGQVMSSVIEEKNSRVVEVLISSVKAVDLMFGKIIGVALVALTQFMLWIVLSVVLVSVAGAFIGQDMLKDISSNPQMMAQTMGVSPDQLSALNLGQAGGSVAVDLSAGDSASAITASSPAAAGDSALASASADSLSAATPAEQDDLSVIIGTLANIPWTRLIISFLLYFLLGYLLYASLYAAIGSAVENEGDAQQLQMPVTIPLMIAYFIILMAFQNPDSQLVVWGSLIPFTSPIVMLARIPYGVPMWQLALSLVLLLLTFIACAWASAKIYKAGILLFGKKTTFKDLWKWLKMK
ncbi:MAG: ABC transporter permease [Bacteroidales bacterium]|nr:ABC transporter permease [Bacteroidales bacterium]